MAPRNAAIAVKCMTDMVGSVSSTIPSHVVAARGAEKAAPPAERPCAYPARLATKNRRGKASRSLPSAWGW